MRYVVWGLGLLVIAGITFVVIQFLTFKRGIHYAKHVTVDGESFTIQIHYGSKFAAKWLKTMGFAMHGHIWMAWPRAVVRRVDVAHEVLHLVREHVVGRWRYTLETSWEWLTQRVHNRRSTEEEPRRGQKGLAVDGWEDVVIAGKVRRVTALFLMEIAT